ncbi:MAG: hypothetical protein K0R54_682 [Clostridiaceae bacterium]|jgi:hypothetical protein|nr:hypothetical protein [Clostridiaceae bacterium]
MKKVFSEKNETVDMKKVASEIYEKYIYENEDERTQHVALLEKAGWVIDSQKKEFTGNLMLDNVKDKSKYIWISKVYKTTLVGYEDEIHISKSVCMTWEEAEHKINKYLTDNYSFIKSAEADRQDFEFVLVIKYTDKQIPEEFIEKLNLDCSLEEAFDECDYKTMVLNLKNVSCFLSNMFGFNVEKSFTSDDEVVFVGN